MSKLEETLALHLRAEKIEFEREVSGLVPGRRFRVDFFIKPVLVLECEGGIWVKGGHSTGAGITRDCEKLNALALEGYIVLRFTAEHIASGEAIGWTKRALRMIEP
jgi:very-short-patch-repair endonuclease